MTKQRSAKPISNPNVVEPSHHTIYKLFYKFRKYLYMESGIVEDRASRMANIDAVSLTGVLFDIHHYCMGGGEESVIDHIQRWSDANSAEDALELLTKIPLGWRIIPLGWRIIASRVEDNSLLCSPIRQ